MDLVSKFIYCFYIYCGKNLEAKIRVFRPFVEASIAYGVVMKLLSGLEDKRHCVVMYNLFCSIPLFTDLEAKGIYAIGIMRSNQIGLPLHLKNTRAWKRCREGHIEWAMHNSRGISCIM